VTEKLLLLHVRAHDLPTPEAQVPIGEEIGRRWRADFLWRDGPRGEPLVVEIDGGAHRAGDRWQRDADKRAWLSAEGYRVVVVTPQQVRSGLAIDLLCWLFGLATREEWERHAERHGLSRRRAKC
jgi:very-short-patch-repair endonuclease